MLEQFILDLHAHSKCSEYLHEFLQRIQMDMLVVKRPDKPDHGRISCTGLWAKLSDLHNKCENDKEYAAKPCPWSRLPNDVKDHSEAVEVVLSDSMAQILKPRLSELRIYEGRHTLLPDSPAALACRELLVGRHRGRGIEAVPRAAVQGMQVVEQEHRGRDTRRNWASSFTSSF